MKLRSCLSVCFMMVAASVFGTAPAVQIVGFDDVHLHVPDPAKAGEWYMKVLGATPTQTPSRVLFGKTLVIFVKNENAKPSKAGVINHIGLSYADVDAKMKEAAAAGAKVLVEPWDTPGLFKAGYVEDPWGVEIELIQDLELLGFHHVHLRVPDPEASLAWYQEMFGGERGKLKERLDGLRYGSLWLLALASRGEPPAPSAGRAIENIAWQVADISQASAALKSKGAKVTGEPRQTKIEGKDTWFMFVEDPNGVRIELLQRSQ